MVRAVSEKPSAGWKRLMDAKGLGSYRRLGDAAGLSHETVRRVVTGRPVDGRTVAAVAGALGVDVELVYALRDEPGPPADAWAPPPSALLLTAAERDVLSRLIGVMTAGREDGGGSGADRAAPMSGALTTDEGVVIAPGESGQQSGSGDRGRGRTSRRRGSGG